MRQKYILILPDGVSDRKLKQLGNKTPLEKARTPNLDFIVKQSIVGSVNTVPEGMDPGSDVANLSILGVNPAKYKIGRGALEALARNIKIKPSQTIFRANFVVVKDGVMYDHSGGGIKSKEAKALIDYLNKNLNNNIKFFSGVDYRNLCLVDKIVKVKTTPPHDILSKKYKNYLPQGKDGKFIQEIMFKIKKLIESYSLYKQGKIKTNMVWLWGDGKTVPVKSFYERYKLKGAIISAVDIIKGIGKLLKMDIIDVPDITADVDTNYENHAIYALKNIDKYDFIYVHIEAPDEASHKGDPYLKIKTIEQIDKKILKPLINSRKNFNLILLPDHPTSTRLRKHLHYPVPFLVWTKNSKVKPKHRYKKFTENILKGNNLKIDKGYKLLDKIFSLLEEKE